MGSERLAQGHVLELLEGLRSLYGFWWSVSKSWQLEQDPNTKGDESYRYAGTIRAPVCFLHRDVYALRCKILQAWQGLYALLSPISGRKFNMRDGLPVHRESDDQSEGDKMIGKPRLVPQDPSSDNPPSSDAPALQASDPEQDDPLADGSSQDSGKAHMIGDALKSVYQRTLEEDIPDDFLDLLKQLK